MSIKKLKKDEFQCDACGEIFKKDWSDKEATEEAETIWGEEVAKPGNRAVVCDDCWKRGMKKIIKELK